MQTDITTKQIAGPAVLYDYLRMHSFGSSGPTAWNDMPAYLRNSDLKLNDFRQLLKTALFRIVSVLPCAPLWKSSVDCAFRYVSLLLSLFFASALWHCWFGDRKGIRPVKNWVLVCCWWWFDWSFARLIAPVVTITSIILSSNKIQNRYILVPANPGPPGKWLLKHIEFIIIIFKIIF